MNAWQLIPVSGNWYWCLGRQQRHLNGRIPGGTNGTRGKDDIRAGGEPVLMRQGRQVIIHLGSYGSIRLWGGVRCNAAADACTHARGRLQGVSKYRVLTFPQKQKNRGAVGDGRVGSLMGWMHEAPRETWIFMHDGEI